MTQLQGQTQLPNKGSTSMLIKAASHVALEGFVNLATCTVFQDQKYYKRNEIINKV
jgi:hypothetical protein